METVRVFCLPLFVERAHAVSPGHDCICVTLVGYMYLTAATLELTAIQLLCSQIILPYVSALDSRLAPLLGSCPSPAVANRKIVYLVLIVSYIAH